MERHLWMKKPHNFPKILVGDCVTSFLDKIVCVAHSETPSGHDSLFKLFLIILDYEFLNSFFLQRESNVNGESNYRVFLLKLAQGLVSDCILDDNEHEGEAGNSSRSMCAECKVVGKRDSRTTIYCIKCKSACCKAHSFKICKNCV